MKFNTSIVATMLRRLESTKESRTHDPPHNSSTVDIALSTRYTLPLLSRTQGYTACDIFTSPHPLIDLQNVAESKMLFNEELYDLFWCKAELADTNSYAWNQDVGLIIHYIISG